MEVEGILGINGRAWKQKLMILGLVFCVGMKYQSELRLGLVLEWWRL